MKDLNPTPRRRHHYLRYSMLLILLILIGVGISIPAILGTPPGQRAILARLNQAFAPGRLSIERIRLSWTGPTLLSGLVLHDPAGQPVLSSPEASIDRSLWRMIVAPKDLGTLRLDQSSLELARTSDGTLNLIQALGQIFTHPDPRRDLTVRILGKVAFRDPALVPPFQAEGMDLTVQFRPSPASLLWTLGLREPAPGATGSIEVSGELDRWKSAPTSATVPNLLAKIKSDGWPVSGEIRGVSVDGRIATSGEIKREGGRWSSNGEARLIQQSSEPTTLELVWNSSVEGEEIQLGGTLGADRLGRLVGPFSAKFQGAYQTKGDRLEIGGLSLSSPWAKMDASGQIASLTGARLADLHGTIAPDYGLLTDQLAKTVEPNAKVMGKPSPWELKGPLASLEGGSRPRDLAVSGGLSLIEADIYGMKLGPTDLRAKLERGLITFDPIDATLNGGRLVLHPTIDLDAPGGPVVRLGSDSLLENAEINDEVSRRVLSFVAPVLDKATQVNGRVSASLVSAEFPIVRSPEKKLNVVGSVQFREVVFAPVLSLATYSR